MPVLIRRLFTFASALSLLACLALLWLPTGRRQWLPSRDGRIEWEALQFAQASRYWELITWYSEPGPEFRLTSVKGFPGPEPIRLIRVTVNTHGFETENQPFFSFFEYPKTTAQWPGYAVQHGYRRIDLNPDGSALRSVYHLGYTEIRDTGNLPYWTVRVPIATLAGVFGVLPAAWLLIAFAGRLFRFLQTRRRRAQRRCIRCGYDLRASKDRCPECGTPTANYPIARPSSLPS